MYSFPHIVVVLRYLNEEKVKYIVFGGVASILYGVPRATYDLDIVLDFSKDNVSAFCRVLKKLNLRPNVPINPEDLSVEEVRKKWVEEKGAKVINFRDPEGKIRLDVSLMYSYDELIKDINVFKLEEVEIEVPVVSKEKLIEMKRKAGRSQDVRDIEYLEKGEEHEL